MRKPRKKQRNYFKIAMMLMFLVCGTLLYKINEKKAFLSFEHLKQNIRLWIPYENLFNFYDHQVSTSIKYQLVSDNYYVNGTNSCVSLFDGIVVQVNETSIVMYHDNGVKITYGHLNDVMVKVDERILKGKTIGMFEDTVQLDFMKDGVVLDYESVLQL